MIAAFTVPAAAFLILAVRYACQLAARDLARRQHPGTRHLSPRHHAQAQRMWAEFDTTGPMPGIDMDGKWPQ